MLAFASLISAAPTTYLWPKWFRYQSHSHIAVNQWPWQRFLNRYLVTNIQQVNLVRYGMVSPVDRYTVTAYISELSQIPVSKLNRRQQLAYWINLYNALMVSQILQFYPIQSVREIALGGDWNPLPGDTQLLKVEKTPISLNDIQEYILRPIWHDPRLHYVLCCGAVGCPNLQDRAFTAYNVMALLDKAAHDFINSPRAVQIIQGKLAVSDIYLWYEDDFGGTDQGIINHLMQYADPNLRIELQKFHKIDHGFFDWSLNS